MIPDDWTIEEQKAVLDELRSAMFREPRWFPAARWCMAVGGVLSVALCTIGGICGPHTHHLVYVAAGCIIGAGLTSIDMRRLEANLYHMGEMDRNILLRMALEERARTKFTETQRHG